MSSASKPARAGSKTGRGQLGAFFKSPSIDAMADRGVRYDNAFTLAPVEKHFQERASTQRSLHFAALRS
jgi:hypothetical protein